MPSHAWIPALALVACTRAASPDAQVVDAAPAVAVLASPDAAPPPPPPPPPPPKPRRWIAGDLHMHVAPPGALRDVTMTIPQIAKQARKNGLEFVIVTPHLWERGWNGPRQRAKWQGLWHDMAALARAQEGVTMIPGVEYGESGVGHFGISGVEIDTLVGDDFLAAVDAAGAFVVVNHPFAIALRDPDIPGSGADYSYKQWTGRNVAPRHDPIDGVEVWNHMLRWARLIQEKKEQQSYAAAAQLVHERRRPIALVGGSDNHREWIEPTTWVYATDPSETTILAALHAGATCVRGIESVIEAHGDEDPSDRWAAIGESAHGARVELRWSGKGRLFIDERDRGVHDGGFLDEAASGLHTYRLEIGRSRCGFVYANL